MPNLEEVVLIGIDILICYAESGSAETAEILTAVADYTDTVAGKAIFPPRGIPEGLRREQRL